MERLTTLTPLVEPISIDEAFLDASSDPRPGEEIARELGYDVLVAPPGTDDSLSVAEDGWDQRWS